MKKPVAYLFVYLAVTYSYISAQTFVKVIDSPVNDPMEAIGTSWGDFDNDGDLDIFINVWTPSVNNLQGYGRLFQNNCNGDFTRITAIPGNILNDAGTWASGASWIDYDNDGY